MISRAHMRTHASKPNHFGSWVLWDWISSINSTYFSCYIILSERELWSKNAVSECDTPIQEYHVGTWHFDPRIPCRNVTLRSKNTVSERDTPIQEYRVETWHSDPRILCRNVTLRSKNTVSERDTPIQEYRVGTWHSDQIILLIYPLLSPLSIHCYIIFIKPSLFEASLR